MGMEESIKKTQRNHEIEIGRDGKPRRKRNKITHLDCERRPARYHQVATAT
ncbi:MAG: hypothetical protein H6Q69_1686 [Firmicutes bacterium]|nr:hypothetical protein [Bacillota bacterium]